MQQRHCCVWLERVLAMSLIPIGGSGNSGYGVGKREVAGKKRCSGRGSNDDADRDHQIYDPNRTGSDACCTTVEGIMWLWKRMVVEAEAGAARVEGSNGVASPEQNREKTAIKGHAAAVLGWRWRRRVEEEGGVGGGTGQQREEKEEGSDEGPTSTMVSSRPMVSSCRKQQRPAVTWL
ncbi:hypothetical protein B296_00025752 [Ensete ventricosum]|uniref:Uncharacterized protein n=1 Tax=Ensete ventricosum TaxID=4639 RepID=A0A426Z1F5_ENSVE|nr:hypothetical protein B296_00025752 [Ensete ventricosum]